MRLVDTKFCSRIEIPPCHFITWSLYFVGRYKLHIHLHGYGFQKHMATGVTTTSHDPLSHRPHNSSRPLSHKRSNSTSLSSSSSIHSSCTTTAGRSPGRFLLQRSFTGVEYS